MAGTEKGGPYARIPEGSHRYSLGAGTVPYTALLQGWDLSHVAARAWKPDPSLWEDAPESDVKERTGWLHLPEEMISQVPDLEDFADRIREEGIVHVVVLGMGGSSLAPKVIQGVIGKRDGYPELLVLDSTHPAVVQSLADRIDPGRTLFIVASKSGTTLEPLSFQRFFWERVRKAGQEPGQRFVAITDAGTPLSDHAQKEGFRRVFHATTTVGGRYSALTHFGLVPAALIGVDLDHLLHGSEAMAARCSPSVPAAENPGISLGAALGVLATEGRDKLTIYAAKGMAPFPVWLEQLLAESTGKAGRGIVPVVGEPLEPPGGYGHDRTFVFLSDRDGGVSPTREHLARLEELGHPVIEIATRGPADLGGEFFRWEMAVAVAGIAIGINPFDQPDVEIAKRLAREAMRRTSQSGPDPHVPSTGTADAARLSLDVARWIGLAKLGDYIAIQAYVAQTAAIERLLQEMRRRLLERTKVATTLGYGPGFLHSTGQLHKGGPPTGLFLQLVDEPSPEIEVPGDGYTFGQIIRAQGIGDYLAMRSMGCRVLRVELGHDGERGLELLLGAFHG